MLNGESILDFFFGHLLFATDLLMIRRRFDAFLIRRRRRFPILLMLIVFGAATQIGFIKEMRKKREIRRVNHEGEIQIFVRLLALVPPAFRSVSGECDKKSDHHLAQLHRRDGHRDPFREPPAERAQRVIRVHHRVHRVIHHDEPAAGGGVIFVRVPCVL